MSDRDGPDNDTDEHASAFIYFEPKNYLSKSYLNDIDSLIIRYHITRVNIGICHLLKILNSNSKLWTKCIAQMSNDLHDDGSSRALQAVLAWQVYWAVASTPRPLADADSIACTPSMPRTAVETGTYFDCCQIISHARPTQRIIYCSPPKTLCMHPQIRAKRFLTRNFIKTYWWVVVDSGNLLRRQFASAGNVTLRSKSIEVSW